MKYRIIDRRKHMRPRDEENKSSITRRPFEIQKYGHSWGTIPGAWYSTKQEAEDETRRMKDELREIGGLDE